MAKFCRYCGIPLPENSRFCVSCGKSQAKSQPQQAVAQQNVLWQATPQQAVLRQFQRLQATLQRDFRLPEAE